MNFVRILNEETLKPRASTECQMMRDFAVSLRKVLELKVVRVVVDQETRPRLVITD